MVLCADKPYQWKVFCRVSMVYVRCESPGLLRKRLPIEYMTIWMLRRVLFETTDFGWLSLIFFVFYWETVFVCEMQT